ncbi:uncharacterized protein LOC120197550 [Hibiscus syriacus]|uniref:uncharacterized protein LOC120197550 n=1 Tax=Hibiscus syriacus TaxID=106335 RepID=UPI0019241E59|nr:uncharacterized protein LOC120197550 [Hibiscus syriacus]
MNSENYAKQKSTFANDPFVGQSGGSSSTQVAVSCSRDAFAGSEVNPQCSHATLLALEHCKNVQVGREVLLNLFTLSRQCLLEIPLMSRTMKQPSRELRACT